MYDPLHCHDSETNLATVETHNGHVACMHMVAVIKTLEVTAISIYRISAIVSEFMSVWFFSLQVILIEKQTLHKFSPVKDTSYTVYCLPSCTIVGH